MIYRHWVVAAFLLTMWRASAQEPVPWHDPSPHSVQFVTVNDNVKLEVLDWGGKGRSLVLLAGGGNTAHVFDDFAPKLTSQYHVYGITRRGFGASSAPASGYSADRLGDDVLVVLDALKLDRPVLAGHSIAGEELSSIGSRHPKRVAGLIYLDAAYGYAIYDSSQGYLSIDLEQLREKLDELRRANLRDTKQLVQNLLQQDLPGFERDLEQLQKNLYAVPAPVPPPAPDTADLASYAAFRSWEMRTQGIAFPEAELRELYETKPDGGVGKHRDYQTPFQAILDQQQKYADIRVPILAIYGDPHDLGTFKNADEREAAEAGDMASVEAQAKAFEVGVPSVRVVRLPHANHYIFLSNEADVLQEMRTFISGLPGT